MSRRLPMRASCAAALLPMIVSSSTQATWSIVIADNETKEVAVGTVTCLDNFDLLALVPVVVVGTGAAAVQSAGDFDGIRRPIIFDSLNAGIAPDTILAILSGVTGHSNRQYGIVDVMGRSTTFSGSLNAPWAGGVTGLDGTMAYSIQANIMTGACVVPAIEQAILNTPGDIAAKLMAGMQAAGAAGGDGRCSCLTGTPTSCGCPPPVFTKPGHIGGMVVARIGDTDDPICNLNGCVDGNYFMRLNVPFQDPSNVNPVIQLQDLFDAWRAGFTGRPDAVQSVVSFNPSGPAPDGAVTTMQITLNDWQGVPITAAIQSLTVVHAPDSDGVSTIGTVVDNGGGSFSVPITSSTATASTDRFRIVLDDGVRSLTLMPDPTLAVEAPVLTDGCSSAPALVEGVFPFDTLGTTTDGPDEPGLCSFSGDTQVGSDIWGCYTPDFDGPVTATLCGSAYNTKMAIYTGCTCPVASSATDCNDDACGGLLQSEISFNVTSGQDYLIRVGGFNGAQGAGSLTITRHLEACCLPDDPCQELRAADCITAGGTPEGEGTFCVNTTCPPTRPRADLIQNSSGGFVASAKNRFLSFSGGSPGGVQAVRVTFVSLPPPFDVWNGIKMFVQSPFDANESPGSGFSDPPQLGDVTFKAANLSCAPFFFGWSTAGTVHVFHEGIVPSKLAVGGGSIETPAVYDIQFLDITGSPNVEADFGPALTLTSSGWADLAELVQGEFLAPDNTISVFDTLAMLTAFSALPGAPIKARSELLSAANGGSPFIDGVVSVIDLLAVLDAFGSGGYPFTPGVTPCQ